jgi:hypothetical protein
LPHRRDTRLVGCSRERVAAWVPLLRL